ncbi:MAG: YfhO family protein [Flavobacteriaceae bacterium]|nr:YfhO family protein [Flavobacteriaceae bacterium]
MKFLKNKAVQFLVAIVIFSMAALAYFSPLLKGERLFQSDIMQFKGISKEIVDYRAQHHEEPYWTNRIFGGMPAYQLSAYYPYDYVKKTDKLFGFLPRPANFVFLYFISFFILLYVLKVEWKLAILGALAFGFSTYLIIIFGAGHNAKAHAIAYMPAVLAGIILTFRKNYLGGFILTALAMAFELNANHPQMTYYLLFMVIILGIVYLADAFRNKELPSFFTATGILVIAVAIAIGLNSTSLLATSQYAKESTRSKSELTLNPDGSPKESIDKGLSKAYITDYSYGFLETMNLLIPRFYGGGSTENVGTDSKTYNFLKDKIGRVQAKNFAENFRSYWGEQPYVEAPAYIGGVLIFLFVLGIFIVKGSIKKWLVAATVFSILLSWGKHVGFVTDFFINYVPFYNKFRAVSSIQVIAEVAIPILAILTLNTLFFKKKEDTDNDFNYLKYTLYIVGGLVLLFVLTGSSLFSFEGPFDKNFESQLAGITDAMVADRKTLFFNDSLRSLVLILLSAGLLWAFLKNKINRTTAFLGIGVLILFDLVGVDKRYLNADDFISKKEQDQPFIATAADKEILKDTSYYRVANFAVDFMNDGSTAYFHNSIGGYHAAKPRRYQEMIEYQLGRQNYEMLNMLNAKYIIFHDNQGNTRMQLNTDANGNAWFVRSAELVKNADGEMQGLDSLNTKVKAVVNEQFRKDLPKLEFPDDSLATIKLTSYAPNELKYKSNTKAEQLAVFSDIYYKDGWNAYIDGKPAPYFRADYVLRAMVVPAGEHEIVYKFEPGIIKKGNTITLISYALLLVIPVGWYFYEKRKSNEPPQQKV